LQGTNSSVAVARLSLALAAERHTLGRLKSKMDETDFEGTLVLEQLAAIGKVEDFFDAVDSDDVDRATQLMKRANIDASTIAVVIGKMEAGGDEH
jgi:hypothetical protein